MGDLFGGGEQESTTTQSAKPWAKLTPYLTDVFRQAKRLSDTPGQFYPGQTYADFDPLQLQGMQGQLDYAGGALPGQIAQAQQAQSGALNAPDVANNPYIAGMADTITSRLGRNFSENLMPAIGDSALMAGQSGGSRQGVAQGIAARGTQEATGDALAGLYGGAYGQGLQAQGNALQRAPQMAQYGLMPSQIQQGIGGMYQGQEQRGIDEGIARQNFANQEPWNRLGNYSNLLAGGQGYGTTTGTTTQSGGGGGLFGNLLGAGMTAAGVMSGNPGMAMSGMGSMFGGGAPTTAGMSPTSSYNYNTGWGSPSLPSSMYF